MNHTIKVPYNSYYQEADQKVNNVMDEWLLGKISSDQFAENVQQILVDYAAKDSGSIENVVLARPCSLQGFYRFKMKGKPCTRF